jgi:hypothetical protein
LVPFESLFLQLAVQPHLLFLLLLLFRSLHRMWQLSLGHMLLLCWLHLRRVSRAWLRGWMWHGSFRRPALPQQAQRLVYPRRCIALRVFVCWLWPLQLARVQSVLLPHQLPVDPNWCDGHRSGDANSNVLCRQVVRTAVLSSSGLMVQLLLLLPPSWGDAQRSQDPKMSKEFV